jgi:hypothetical protein
MAATKSQRPAAQARMLRVETMEDPARAADVQADGISALETKLGRLQKLITDPVSVTGSKGGNAALASLIAALASLGLVKDETT